MVLSSQPREVGRYQGQEVHLADCSVKNLQATKQATEGLRENLIQTKQISKLFREGRSEVGSKFCNSLVLFQVLYRWR